MMLAGPPVPDPTGMYEGSSREAIAEFKGALDRARLPSTVRGQLAATR
jgi:hypothetical protein